MRDPLSPHADEGRWKRARTIGRCMLVASIASVSTLAITRAARSQDEGGGESGKNKLHLPVADDVAALLEGANRAAKEGDFDRAADLVRAVMEKDEDARHPNRIIPVEDGTPMAAAVVSDPPLRRFAGVCERATEVLRGFPKEARDAYRKKFDYKAKAAFAVALENDAKPGELLTVYDRFPIATCAHEILEVVADRSFERGEIERARRLYERLLRHHKADLASPPLVREKLVLACVQLGRRADVERLLDALAAEDKDARIHIRGAAVSRSDLVALTLKCASRARGDDADSKASLALPRGDAANRATYARPLRVGTSRFKDSPRRELERQEFERYRSGEDARFLPVVWNDTIFVPMAEKIRAFSLDGTEKPRIPMLGTTCPEDNDKIQYGAAADRGVVIAPYVDEVVPSQEFRGIPIRVNMPIRKLAGFDVDRWRWTWKHKDILAGTKAARASFPVAPVCEDGCSFVSAFAIEGFVHCYAASFDSQTGALLWWTWLESGQVEQTMFGEHAREPLCAPVCEGDGVVFDATQMGCVAALDADTGRIKWISEYDQIEVRAPKGYYADPRNIAWANNAPILSDGVLVAAPMDSEYYYGFDAATGKQLWRRARVSAVFDQGAELKYLFAASEGKVVLAGGRRVVCVNLRTGKEAWPPVTLDGRLVSGRGVIAGGKIVVPATDSIQVLDLATGSREGPKPVVLTGNLSLAGDSLIVASENQLGAFANERVEKSRSKDF